MKVTKKKKKRKKTHNKNEDLSSSDTSKTMSIFFSMKYLVFVEGYDRFIVLPIHGKQLYFFTLFVN